MRSYWIGLCLVTMLLTSCRRDVDDAQLDFDSHVILQKSKQAIEICKADVSGDACADALAEYRIARAHYFSRYHKARKEVR